MKRHIYTAVIVSTFLIILGYAGKHFFFPEKVDPYDRICKDVGRILNEREIIDRSFFGDDANRLSLAEKKKIMFDRVGAVYPDCCYIGNLEENWNADDPDEIPNYILYVAHPASDIATRRPSEAYEIDMKFIDQCGETLQRWGENVSQQTYDKKLDSIRKYWKQQETKDQ